MSSRVVAVDVGNSTVGLATHTSDRLTSHFVSLGETDWIADCIEWARRQLGLGKIRWVIASVQAAATIELIAALSESHEDEVHQIEMMDVPIKVSVDYPERVGIDRLLAAHAASSVLTPPFAVVDAGSAITVDWVDQHGHFCGGAILPGLSLQAAALHQGTDALPELAFENDQTLRLPGRNTREAIRGGILFGTAAAVDALVARYAESHGVRPPEIALTGGQAALIAPLMEQNHRLLPNLVCRGLLELPRSKRYAESKSGIH